MARKNNLPPSHGFGKKPEPEFDEFARKCLTCGLILADDMPRGIVLNGGELKGVQCISCAEADEESIKFGTPKNPLG